jgi:hypothetical protein
MGSLNTGGGSSAVAASAHASCERHRKTDPLATQISRRELARRLGHPDTSAGIPEARWMRAMTFERLVRDKNFMSQLLTSIVGGIGLKRPKAVRCADGGVDVGTTIAALAKAHECAMTANETTIITNLAIPFVGMEAEARSTPVKPDFAVITARPSDADPQVSDGSWLIMGDAKDYERLRSRIDDQRMLKGFLQVALGAESAAAWSHLPAGMRVHRWGALAVPRNAFLQPEAVLECLDDHRHEVRTRASERVALVGGGAVPAEKLPIYVEHLNAAFDPARCPSCSLFQYCRHTLRQANDDGALLVELGVRVEHRPPILAYLREGKLPKGVPESVVAGVRATRAGLAEWSGNGRVDPIGRSGTVEVVLAKSDAAALGVHGVSVRTRGGGRGDEEWATQVFPDPQSPKTRTQVMAVVGEALTRAMKRQDRAGTDPPPPVHMVVPDSVTADVLISIADSLAGVELSRLRWERDREMGRPPLTFSGEAATVPEKLPKLARLAVSFLLEADRSRAMTLRRPVINLGSVLAAHVVAGGPAVEGGRLDYLVEWAEATTPLDHRTVSDDIARRASTPGARLSNSRSGVIHEAAHGKHGRRGRGKPDPKRYERLVREELAYKTRTVERAVDTLARLPDSRLREVYEAIEQEAQQIWRRRLRLHASDLVRFGRMSNDWRNDLVDLLDADARCAQQLQAIGNPQAAADMAESAGNREVARATVVSTKPLRLRVESRRIADGSRIIALHINGEAIVEDDVVDIKHQKGSFKFSGISEGLLVADEQTRQYSSLVWQPKIVPPLRKGSVLIVADADWFTTFESGTQMAIPRPRADAKSAPQEHCDEDSYADDPAGHRFCCQPHEAAEAQVSDWLAGKRERGELNPRTWPPIIDSDQFDVTAKGTATDTSMSSATEGSAPPDLTVDDVD